MTIVAFTGTHGNGKTTAINILADHYADTGKSVCIVGEVSRSCPHPLGTIKAQRFIWYKHYSREIDALASGCDVVLVDRSLMDNMVYLRYILDHTNNKIGEEMFRLLYPITKTWMSIYDVVVRLPINEEYILNSDDSLRPRDLEYARDIDRIFDDLVEPFVTHHGKYPTSF